MTLEPLETPVGKTQDATQELAVTKAEDCSRTIYEHGDKEFFSPFELGGPTIPRGRHFSETSSTIAPQVISTNVSHQTDPHPHAESTNGRVELSTERHEAGRDTGLVPRGIGTKWSQLPKARRTKILLMVVAAAVGVVVAVLLAVLLTRRQSETRPTDAFAILPTSKLAALAFQDASNNTEKSVFFQLASSHALMRARSNSSITTTATGQQQQWTFENVSQSMIAGGSAILPKAGTPLVAVAPPAVDAADLSNFWVDLYFLSAANVPFQIWSWSTPQTEPSKDQLWHQEGLQNYQAIFNTGFAAGTQLGAYRDQCGDVGCSNSSRLLYQGANGDLMMGMSAIAKWMEWNVTNLSDEAVGSPLLPRLEMNSSLAVAPMSPAPGQKPVGMRMYYDVSHQLEEYMLVNGTWRNGSLEASLGDQATPPDVSAVTFPAVAGGASFDSTLITVLFDNGSIAVHWQESVGAGWSTGLAPPTNVSALAVNSGLLAYCLTEGRIQEWEIDRLLPTKWTLVGNVTTV